MMKSLFPFSFALIVSLSACGPGNGADPCVGSDAPEVLVGQGVGGAFVELADGEEVTLSVAPQGGFGVPVVVQTRGLAAGDLVQSMVLLDAERMGENLGTFSTRAPLQCRSDGDGGNISGIVVGFDPSRFRTNDDLLALDGTVVDLAITIMDEDGRMGMVIKPVTVRVGG